MTLEHLKKRKLTVVSNTEANMLMIDWKTKPANDMKLAFPYPECRDRPQLADLAHGLASHRGFHG